MTEAQADQVIVFLGQLLDVGLVIAVSTSMIFGVSLWRAFILGKDRRSVW